MFSWLFLLIACADPTPVALDTCKAIPSLATDEEGLQLLEPLLTHRDFRTLKKADPTLGLQKVGATGLAKLRAQARCEVVEVLDAGHNRWNVTVTRTLPEVNADGSLGDPQETTLNWSVVRSKDGLKVETGLFQAADTRRQAEESAARGDLKRAAGLWRAVYQKFPDPMLQVDIATATDIAAKALYRKRLVGNLISITPAEDEGANPILNAEVTNRGKRYVSKAVIELSFDVGTDQKLVLHEVGEIKPGETAAFQVEVPQEADGLVHFSTHEVEF